MLNTLFGRLFIASVIILSLSFGIIAYIINELIIDNVYLSKQEQLRVQNYVLLSSAKITGTSITFPDELREPLFDTFESGLYGYVSDIHGNALWQSYSAHTLTTPQNILQTQITEPGQFEYSVTENYFVYQYVVLWELEADKPQLLTFTVIEDKQPTMQAINDFKHLLYRWLIAICLGLIITLLLILRWGTKPLRQLSNNLKKIESGHAKNIQGQYPIELRGVASNLNQLIESERAQRDRYYTTMSDLAHSLKTPLAVIKAELSSQEHSTQNQLIADQTQRMDEIIKHQLQRAVMVTTHRLADTILIEKSVTRVITALKKVYANKNIRFETTIDANCTFKGDQRDLLEIIGNVLDNACKACKSSIKIEAKQTSNNLTISIHDDGEGIAQELREHLLIRGQRADTRHPGQGIGLDVVRDIIQNYQGQFTIDQSPLGGALFQFQFRQ